MATIQVRDIPEETYEFFRSRAAAAGQSLQAYVHDHLVDVADSQARKERAIRDLESRLAESGGTGLSPEEIVAHVQAERR